MAAPILPDDQPICYICGKPVDGLQMTYDRRLEGHRITAACHGREVHYFVSDHPSTDPEPKILTEGIAFAPGEQTVS